VKLSLLVTSPVSVWFKSNQITIAKAPGI